MAVYDINGVIISDNSSFTGEMKSLSAYGDISTATGFLKAFNLAIADDSICGITIPKGEYNTGGTLNISRSNFVIDGNGSTLNMRNDSGATIAANCFAINNQDRITIKNFLINMRQNKNTSTGSAFYFLDASRVTVENIDVFSIGCRGALIYNTDATSETPGATKMFFRNVKLRGIDDQNTVESAWPCGIIAVNLVDSRFEECVISGMCRFTIEFKNYTKNCCMINNVVYGNSFDYMHESGIALGCDRPADEGDKIADGIIFIGNIVRNCKYPLYIGRTSNLIVSNNILEGQMFMQEINSAVISGNIVKSTDKFNIPLIDLGGSNDILFTGNIYEPDSNDLFLMETYKPQTNIFVNGLLNGKEINVVNPTSGTPTTA